MFDQLTPNFGKPEQVVVIPAEERKLLGEIRIQPGHRLWIIDTESMEAEEAQIRTTMTDGRKFVMNDPEGKKVYVPALNKKNAIRKLRKWMENAG